MTNQLLVLLTVVATIAATTTELAMATPDPDKNFFQNFREPAYFLPVPPLAGALLGGDLTASYDQAYMPVKHWAELLIVGEFPRARYFSITLYDDHGAIIDTLRDDQLEPLLFGESNPYRLGGPAGAEDILYAVRVQLGDSMADDPVAGCRLDDFNVTSNILDGRYRHIAGTLYSAEQSQYSVTIGNRTIVHDDALENLSVSLVVRRVLEVDDGNTGAFDRTTPLVFVRSASTGCALNMWNLVGKPQPTPESFLPPEEWFSFNTSADIEQVVGHNKHSTEMPIQQPYGLDPFNHAAWYRGPEYVLTANPDTGYLSAGITASAKPAALNAAGKVMRLRFRLPQTPCAASSCPLTGAEQIRYWGLTFIEGQGTAVYSISDLDLNPNASGYVDLIISYGAPLPAWVTPANGYSVVNIPPSDIRLMTLRNIVPGPGFDCTADEVPFKTNEHHGNGGYMGDYAPLMTLPDAATLPQTAVPVIRGGSCTPP